MKRKICIFTGTRAEYGLLKPLIEEIKKDSDLQLQIIASGTHLSAEFGLTYREIEKDGFKINEKIEMLLSSDTSVGISKSMGLAMISFPEAYQRLKPDIIVVLGDRFEHFSAVASALVSRIPVAHIAGGEVTGGVFDDAFRHSITKMSHLHFTIAEEYRRRVIQLGEDPKRVFNVGGLGIDNIKRMPLLLKRDIEGQLHFKFKKRNLLVTFHPASLEPHKSQDRFQNLLEALDSLKNTLIIFTKANADTGGRIINEMIDKYTLDNHSKAVAFVSLGQLRYLSTMKYVDAVVGNSSSGIVEAPSFKIGTINIGNRQEGRIRAESVIDCDPIRESIDDAFAKLYSKGFQAVLKEVISPFGDGQASERIVAVLADVALADLMSKRFHDIPLSSRSQS